MEATTNLPTLPTLFTELIEQFLMHRNAIDPTAFTVRSRSSFTEDLAPNCDKFGHNTTTYWMDFTCTKHKREAI